MMSTQPACAIISQRMTPGTTGFLGNAPVKTIRPLHEILADGFVLLDEKGFVDQEHRPPSAG